jgi:tetratricopeptide (TPR) repeat protein
MIAMALLYSCQSKLEKLEEAVYSEDFVYDSKGLEKAGELQDLYVELAESNPGDTLSAEYYFKAAELAMNLNKTQQALELYNKIIYTFPEFKKAPESLFLMAFIYENTLQNYGRAKELYELFLEKYPDHDFADDARFSLMYLGKSPEELMKEFEEKNAATGADVVM